MLEFLFGAAFGVVGMRLGKPIFQWFVKKEARLIKELQKDD